MQEEIIDSGAQVRDAMYNKRAPHDKFTRLAVADPVTRKYFFLQEELNSDGTISLSTCRNRAMKFPNRDKAHEAGQEIMKISGANYIIEPWYTQIDQRDGSSKSLS